MPLEIERTSSMSAPSYTCVHINMYKFVACLNGQNLNRLKKSKSGSGLLKN